MLILIITIFIFIRSQYEIFEYTNAILQIGSYGNYAIPEGKTITVAGNFA